MTTLVAGLVLGLASAVHCAGMCGPLVVLSGARDHGAADRRAGWRRVAAYHAGRTTTYILLGLLAGAAGGVLAGAGFGRVLAVSVGALLLVHVLGLLPSSPANAVSRAMGGLTVSAARVLRRRGLDAPFVHGALHGLLPCGVLYLAAAAAAGFGDVAQAALFMAGFAAGTTPILATIALAAPAVAQRLPVPVTRAAPMAVGLIGLLLVARGFGVLPGGHGGHVAPAPSSTGSHASHGGHQAHTP